MAGSGGGAVDDLLRAFVDELSLDGVVAACAAGARASVPAASGASVHLTSGADVLLGATGDAAEEIERVQRELGGGPSGEARSTCRVVRWTAADRGRPELSEACGRHRVEEILAAPLVKEGEAFGSVAVHAPAGRGFADDDLDAFVAYADTASAILWNATAYWGRVRLAENLSQALVSRAVIEQAKGVIVAQASITPDEAFERLRQASRRTGRKLSLIAAEVVERAAGG